MFKNYILNKKAVCFDLDGTLADTDDIWAQAFDKVLKANDAEYVSLEQVYGCTLKDRWEYVLHEYHIKTKSTIKELAQHTVTEMIQLLKTYPIDVRPGFWDLASKLKEKNLKLALTSNTGCEAINAFLTKFGIHATFDLVLGADDVKNTKPDPEIYLTAAKKLGVRPSELLVFEDPIWGATSAKKAKTDVIVIWNEKIRKVEYPDGILTYLPDFDGIADKLDYTPEEYLNFKIQTALERKQANQ